MRTSVYTILLTLPYFRTGHSKTYRASWAKVIAKQSGPSLPDLPTVTAIALVAYAASNVLHEAVGHGGTCLALGGRPLVLSSVHFECGEQGISALASPDAREEKVAR